MMYHFHKERIRRLLVPCWRLTRKRDRDKEVVVMFHVGRCGSTVLGDLLNQHPKVHWDGETFPFLYLNRKSNETRYRELEPDVWKQHLKFRKKLAPGRLYGLEVKFFHCRWLGVSVDELLDELGKYGKIHVIVLQRKNLLRSIVSQQVALQTGRWHSYEQKASRIAAITLNTSALFQDHEHTTLLKSLEEWHQNYNALRGCLEKRNQAFTWLTYEEDLEKNPLRAYDKVVGDLQLSKYTPRVRFKKAQKYSLRDQLSNYEHVLEELRGSPFEWMVND